MFQWIVFFLSFCDIFISCCKLHVLYSSLDIFSLVRTLQCPTMFPITLSFLFVSFLLDFCIASWKLLISLNPDRQGLKIEAGKYLFQDLNTCLVLAIRPFCKVSFWSLSYVKIISHRAIGLSLLLFLVFSENNGGLCWSPHRWVRLIHFFLSLVV